MDSVYLSQSQKNEERFGQDSKDEDQDSKDEDQDSEHLSQSQKNGGTKRKRNEEEKSFGQDSEHEDQDSKDEDKDSKDEDQDSKHEDKDSEGSNLEKTTRTSQKSKKKEIEIVRRSSRKRVLMYKELKGMDNAIEGTAEKFIPGGGKRQNVPSNVHAKVLEKAKNSMIIGSLDKTNGNFETPCGICNLPLRLDAKGKEVGKKVFFNQGKNSRIQKAPMCHGAYNASGIHDAYHKYKQELTQNMSADEVRDLEAHEDKIIRHLQWSDINNLSLGHKDCNEKHPPSDKTWDKKTQSEKNELKEYVKNNWPDHLFKRKRKQ